MEQSRMVRAGDTHPDSLCGHGGLSHLGPGVRTLSEWKAQVVPGEPILGSEVAHNSQVRVGVVSVLVTAGAHPSHLCTPRLLTSWGQGRRSMGETLMVPVPMCLHTLSSGPGVTSLLDRFLSVIMSTPWAFRPCQHWAWPGDTTENRPDVIPVLGAGNQAFTTSL